MTKKKKQIIEPGIYLGQKDNEGNTVLIKVGRNQNTIPSTQITISGDPTDMLFGVDLKSILS